MIQQYHLIFLSMKELTPEAITINSLITFHYYLRKPDVNETFFLKNLNFEKFKFWILSKLNNSSITLLTSAKLYLLAKFQESCTLHGPKRFRKCHDIHANIKAFDLFFKT